MRSRSPLDAYRDTAPRRDGRCPRLGSSSVAEVDHGFFSCNFPGGMPFNDIFTQNGCSGIIEVWCSSAQAYDKCCEFRRSELGARCSALGPSKLIVSPTGGLCNNVSDRQSNFPTCLTPCSSFKTSISGNGCVLLRSSLGCSLGDASFCSYIEF